MAGLNFYKLQASGNDFVLLDLRLKTSDYRPACKKLAKMWCERKYGVGADGLLIIEKSKKADFKMRIFNPDGSEAEMCGNGARCAALYWAKSIEHSAKRKIMKFDTKAGVIEAEVSKSGNVKVKLSDPATIRLGIPLVISGRKIEVDYINTGVPHTVIFVEGLDKIDVEAIGRQVRQHKKFKPAGANVDFVEFKDDKTINIRTYERGVERETLACGTGVVASAVVSEVRSQSLEARRQQSEKVPSEVEGKPENSRKMMKVKTKGGDVLKVYFEQRGKKVSNTWLEGKAYIIYEGDISI